MMIFKQKTHKQKYAKRHKSKLLLYNSVPKQKQKKKPNPHFEINPENIKWVENVIDADINLISDIIEGNGYNEAFSKEELVINIFSFINKNRNEAIKLLEKIYPRTTKIDILKTQKQNPIWDANF